MIIKAIKFIIVALLAVVYWPINAIFMYIRDHYLRWQKTDKISFILATPLYWLFYVLVVIISAPLEAMGTALHPALDKFR